MSLRLLMGNGSGLSAFLVIVLGTTTVGASALGTITGTTGINSVSQVGPKNQLVGTGVVAATGALHAMAVNEAGTVYDLGTLGGTSSSAAGINASLAIVGASNITGDSTQHAFLYSRGAMKDLGTLGGASSYATGINASGQIVGTSDTSSLTTHAFLYSGQVMTDLGTLGGTLSSAAGINNLGQVVGQSSLANGDTHAFVTINGVMTDLGTLGGSSSFGYGINNQGQVVGQSYTTNDDAAHAFIWSKGKMTDIGTLAGFTSSTATAINDLGAVVGYGYGGFDAITHLPNQHAFLYQNGVMTDLNTLIPAGSGWTFTQVVSINDNGVITGFGMLNGKKEVFSVVVASAGLPSPVATPEPSLLALAGMVFAGLGARRVARHLRAKV